MAKYSVWNVDGSFGWCSGNFPYVEKEHGECGYNFCTNDINRAFQYREDIAGRFPKCNYEVREYQ